MVVKKKVVTKTPKKTPREIMTGKWYFDVDGKTYAGILHVVHSPRRGEGHVYVGKTHIMQFDDVWSEMEAKSELKSLINDGILVRK